MKKNGKRQPIGTILTMLLFVLFAQGCNGGEISDSSGNALPDVEVIAIANCQGAGCAAHQTEITIGSETHTGYRLTTDSTGKYFYDPYAVQVAPEDAMWIYKPEGDPDPIKFSISKSGYQDILLHYVPQYETITDPDTGEEYLVSEVPEMYLCRDDEIDTDGDNLCDAVEELYGSSPTNVDTNGDGENDDVEIYVLGEETPGSLEDCVGAYCFDELIWCMTGVDENGFDDDGECSGWLDCIEACGDDDMLCPTVCGSFFQSPIKDAFSQCALDNGCYSIEFPDLPACDLPEAEHVAVGNIDGFWWCSAVEADIDYAFYEDCQAFTFDELNETEIDTVSKHIVTYNGEERTAVNPALFTRSANGYLELVYDTWVGYSEQWHPYYVTPNVMVMHVCSVGTDNECHDWATCILTRVPLESLDSGEMAALEAALGNVFQTTLADYTLIRTSDCPSDITMP